MRWRRASGSPELFVGNIRLLEMRAIVSQVKAEWKSRGDETIE